MILGRGTATSDEAILAEFEAFLVAHSGIATARVRDRVTGSAHTVYRRIGGPIAAWTEQEVLATLADRSKATVYGYCVFLAFLLFRGYFRVREVAFFALLPIRQKLEATRTALSYAPEGPIGAMGSGATGSVLNLLIYLLIFIAKPLEELTRADFDAFGTAYDQWYRAAECRTDGSHDARLARLERYLVHWGALPPRRVKVKHEEHFARLQHEAIKAAIVVYMRWCEVKYQASTIYSYRAGVLGFFLWLQTQHPSVARLDGVTRPMALEYATHLKRKVEAGTYTSKYRSDLYRCIRLFYEFAIVERLETSPDRNPFAVGDTPSVSNPVPRYLTDHEIQVVLGYCSSEATLVERVVFITLLHTGIRACELVQLKTTDLVQIQGRWKLHIHEGKGLKDRLIPLTEPCLEVLHAWKEQRWEQVTAYLFTTHGRRWAASTSSSVCARIQLHRRRLSSLARSPAWVHSTATARTNA